MWIVRRKDQMEYSCLRSLSVWNQGFRALKKKKKIISQLEAKMACSNLACAVSPDFLE